MVTLSITIITVIVMILSKLLLLLAIITSMIIEPSARKVLIAAHNVQRSQHVASPLLWQCLHLKLQSSEIKSVAVTRYA